MDSKTINAVIETIDTRIQRLTELAAEAQKSGDSHFAEAYRGRAWELVLTVDAIERLQVEAPPKAA